MPVVADSEWQNELLECGGITASLLLYCWVVKPGKYPRSRAMIACRSPNILGCPLSLGWC